MTIGKVTDVNNLNLLNGTVNHDLQLITAIPNLFMHMYQCNLFWHQKFKTSTNFARPGYFIKLNEYPFFLSMVKISFKLRFVLIIFELLFNGPHKNVI